MTDGASLADEAVARLRALDITVRFRDAYPLLGYGQDTAYDDAASGDFPIPIRKIGRRLVVNKFDLIRALGGHELLVELGMAARKPASAA